MLFRSKFHQFFLVSKTPIESNPVSTSNFVIAKLLKSFNSLACFKSYKSNQPTRLVLPVFVPISLPRVCKCSLTEPSKISVLNVCLICFRTLSSLDVGFKLL